jgi:ubiquinone/menaquinone biosynthesis C-methylase UbiE
LTEAQSPISPPAAWPVLDLLACPDCRARLRGGPGGDGLLCTSCDQHWPATSGWLDFRPEDQRLGQHWRDRQTSMEGWYENLITASDQAELCWRHDYDPLAGILGGLRGTILDVGGGNGIVRQYLPPGADCVVLDPSPEWLAADWMQVARSFPALLSPITFVLGIGERLPFGSARFDAVLSLFSINHAADPPSLVQEAARVLRPGGRLLIVAEDVEPRWRDLPTAGYRSGWTPLHRGVRQKLAADLGLRPWPIHPEHLAITEDDLRVWLSDDFELRDRSWVAGWLTLDAIKRDSSGSR